MWKLSWFILTAYKEAENKIAPPEIRQGENIGKKGHATTAGLNIYPYIRYAPRGTALCAVVKGKNPKSSGKPRRIRVGLMGQVQLKEDNLY